MQAMPPYLFSILSAPNSVLKEIRRLQCNFLWGGHEEKAKFSLVCWEDVCRPKERGVLGLRDPKVMLKIQGAKVWWRWVNHTSKPWAKIWHIKYARDGPIQPLIRFNESQSGSPIWLKALAGKNIVQEHLLGRSRVLAGQNFGRIRGTSFPSLDEIRDGRILRIRQLRGARSM